MVAASALVTVRARATRAVNFFMSVSVIDDGTNILVNGGKRNKFSLDCLGPPIGSVPIAFSVVAFFAKHLEIVEI